MAIIVNCHCGRVLRAKDEQAGRQCRCPACGAALNVPYPAARAAEPPVPLASEHPEHPASALTAALNVHRARAAEHHASPPVEVPSSTPSTLPMNAVQRTERTWRGHVYWILLLAVIPLVHITLIHKPDVEDRLEKLLQQDEKSRPRFENGGISDRLDQILHAYPGHRLEGAFLARETRAHWPIALVAAILFFGVVVTAIPSDEVGPKDLFFSGLFTATLGVALLLTFQYFGLCFCLIGIWYRPALDPSAPFGPSLLGFILSVGVTEEITKVIPVLWRIHKDDIDWRGACLIGMASGAGFGVAEGVHYCMNFYNGVAPVSIYLVRFASATSLHIMLSGACGIMIFNKRKHLGEWLDVYDWVLTMTALMIVPIILHGLYDALLKQHWDGAALGVWLATFAWLAWLITRARENEVKQTRKALEGAAKTVRTEKGTRFVGT